MGSPNPFLVSSAITATVTGRVRHAVFTVVFSRILRASRLLPGPHGSVSSHNPRVRSLTSRAVLAGLALAAIGAPSLRPSAQAPEPRVIEVTARRFAFEPPEIEATVGERLRLVVRSADGVHGLEIKKFKVKKEIPRGGMPVTIEFTATGEGRFPILCSEYCGDDHDDMKGMLVVRGMPLQPDQEPDRP